VHADKATRTTHDTREIDFCDRVTDMVPAIVAPGRRIERGRVSNCYGDRPPSCGFIADRRRPGLVRRNTRATAPRTVQIGAAGALPGDAVEQSQPPVIGPVSFAPLPPWPPGAPPIPTPEIPALPVVPALPLVPAPPVVPPPPVVPALPLLPA